MARLLDVLRDKVTPTLLRELPGRIRDELGDWEIDPARYRDEVDEILRYYMDQGLPKRDLNKAKKILTDRDLIDRIRGV